MILGVTNAFGLTFHPGSALALNIHRMRSACYKNGYFPLGCGRAMQEQNQSFRPHWSRVVAVPLRIGSLGWTARQHWHHADRAPQFQEWLKAKPRGESGLFPCRERGQVRLVCFLRGIRTCRPLRPGRRRLRSRDQRALREQPAEASPSLDHDTLASRLTAQQTEDENPRTNLLWS